MLDQEPKQASMTEMSEREMARLPNFSEAGDLNHANLVHKSTMIVDAFPDRIPHARELEDMTRAFGPDLVSMSLLKILTSVVPNKYFIERVDRFYRDLRLKKFQSVQTGVTQDERAELCVIESVDPLTPGVTWGSHVETWRSWGRRIGLTTEVIQTKQSNSLLANAELIRRELMEHPHERRIIATVGQGGAEFRLLVEQLLKTAPHELSGIQMWLNVSGLVRGGSGISLAQKSWWNRQMTALFSRLRGWPFSMPQQLQHTNPRLRNEPELHGLPFVCVSMVGFPTAVQVPLGLKGSFLNMVALGPNDGLCFFHESVLRPGYVVAVPGMSHAAEAERLGLWFQAVLATYLDDKKSYPTKV